MNYVEFYLMDVHTLLPVVGVCMYVLMYTHSPFWIVYTSSSVTFIACDIVTLVDLEMLKSSTIL